MPRRVSHLVHWLLIITLIATTLVVPAQATEEVLQNATASRITAAMGEMPCDDEMASSTDAHERPCDCCTQASCDLSACLGTAYLHALPLLVAAIPLHTPHVTSNTPTPPSRSFDTPLRPPIA